MGIGALGAGTAFVRAPAPATGTVVEPEATTPSPVFVMPSSSVEPPSQAIPVASIRGRVRVNPAGANVTLDGARATLTDGMLEIVGVAESKHFVKVASGEIIEVVLHANGSVSPDTIRAIREAKPVPASSGVSSAKPLPSSSIRMRDKFE